MSKILIVVIGVVIGLAAIVLYFNRAYAHIYDFIEDNREQSHTTEKIIHLTSPYASTSAQSKKISLVVLGDSLTSGMGASDKTKTYPYQLAQKLTKQYDDVTVTNMGIPGITTKELITLELQEAINLKPDQILLLVGTNDVHNLVSDKNFEDNYRTIVKEIKDKTDSRLTVMTIPYLGHKELINLPYDLLLNSRTQKFNEIIKKIAIENNLGVIDLYTITLHQFEDKSYYSKDMFHPGDKGYTLWTEIIACNYLPQDCTLSK